MNRLLLVCLISLSSCNMANYHLRLSKKHLLKAIAAGAKLDSIKTIVHDTIKTQSFTDRKVYETKIDTVKLEKLCPEVKTKTQRKAVQSIICPDVKKDTTYNIRVTVGAHKYVVPIRIVASSIAGEAKLEVDAKEIKIPYEKQIVTVEAKPEKFIKWWQVVLIGLSCLVVGFVLGKIFKFGVSL